MLVHLHDFTRFFFLAFSALLPLINPLGSALVFTGLVGAVPLSVYRSLARRVAINTTLFLCIIQLVGTAILRFFGISLQVVEVAGGLSLAAMGWRLLNQEQAQPKKEVAELDDHAVGSLHQKAFYPFTFPVTAGPGSLVVMITLSAHAPESRVFRGFPDLSSHAGITAAVVVLSLSVYFCYRYAPLITSRISQQTAHGVARVIAFVLLCIGVQIMWNGLAVLLKTVM